MTTFYLFYLSFDKTQVSIGLVFSHVQMFSFVSAVDFSSLCVLA